MAYYHVAGEGWEKNQALYCWDILTEMGEEPRWKWDSEPGAFDTGVVCLFDNLKAAAEFQASFGGTVLRVWMPESFLAGDTYSWWDAWSQRHIQSCFGGPNVEGFYYIEAGIPAEWLLPVAQRHLDKALVG